MDDFLRSSRKSLAIVAWSRDGSLDLPALAALSASLGTSSAPVRRCLVQPHSESTLFNPGPDSRTALHAGGPSLGGQSDSATAKSESPTRGHFGSEGWERFESLAVAAQATGAQRFLLCDEGADIPPALVTELLQSSTPACGIVGPPPAGFSWPTALWMKILGVISRILLGTRGHRFRPVVVHLDRTALEAALASPLQPVDNATLIAAIKSSAITVPESTWCNGELDVKSGAETFAAEVRAEVLAVLRRWWHGLKFPGGDRLRQPHARPPLGWWAWPVLITVSLLTLSANLRYPLFEPDEARNAQLAINIVQTGQWMALELADEPYWDKPPLVPWMIAASYHTFGISEWSTRLPGNLASLSLIVLTFAWGRRLVGYRAAWFAALMLALTCGFTICGRYVTMDSALSLATTVTLWTAYFACGGAGYCTVIHPANVSAGRGPGPAAGVDGQFSVGWWILSAIAGGCGLLIKGPIIAVLTLPVLITAHLLAGNRSLIDIRRWVMYLAICGLIAGPWYIATAWVQPEFLVYFFWRHNVVRFSDAFNHDEPWWFYLPVLFVVLFPISYLLPTLARALWTNEAAVRRERTPAVGLLVLSSAWILCFFSLSSSKLPSYILPAFPALALLLGFVVDRFVLSSAATSLTCGWLQWIPCRATRLLLGLFLVGAVAQAFLLRSTGVPWLLMTLSVGIGMGMGTWVAGLRRMTLHGAWGSFAVVSLLWLHWSNATLLPAVSSYRSVHQAMRAVRDRPEFARTPLAFYCHESYGSALWLGRESCPEFEDEDRHRLREFLLEHRQVLLVSRDEPIEIVRDSLPWPLSITKVPGARHLYLCAEREQRNGAPRVAERYIPEQTTRR